MFIKICGLTQLDNALEVAETGISAIGLLLTASPRQVSPEQARTIALALKGQVWRVGVIRDLPPQQALELARFIGLDALQLHGQEPAAWAQQIGQVLPVIKAIKLAGPANPDYLNYPAWALLADGAQPGSGQSYNPEWVLPLESHPRLILAGGITPANACERVQAVRPFGLDVSSGVEVSPGLKDPEAVRALLRAVADCP